MPGEAIGLGDLDWVPHPEVWLLLVGALALGAYASIVLQPKAVQAGYEPITRSQRTWFALGFVGVWLASDWPVHDVAEQYLYSVHMVQHLLLSILLPATFLLATPRWLIELIVRPGSGLWNWLRRGSRPLFAGVLFNVLTALLHWGKVVQLSADSGAAHYLFHLLIFSSGLLMWMPVVGPITEWRLPPIGQCIYLFMMSILPTVPGGWLVFATGVVYPHYDTPQRLWGLDALSDQQAAGAIMKLFGGFVLWAIILVIFSRWAFSEQKANELAREARVREPALTYAEVEKAFATSVGPRED